MKTMVPYEKDSVGACSGSVGGNKCECKHFVQKHHHSRTRPCTRRCPAFTGHDNSRTFLYESSAIGVQIRFNGVPTRQDISRMESLVQDARATASRLWPNAERIPAEAMDIRQLAEQIIYPTGAYTEQLGDGSVLALRLLGRYRFHPQNFPRRYAAIPAPPEPLSPEDIADVHRRMATVTANLAQVLAVYRKSPRSEFDISAQQDLADAFNYVQAWAHLAPTNTDEWVELLYNRIESIETVSGMIDQIKMLSDPRLVIVHGLAYSKNQFTWSRIANAFHIPESDWPPNPMEGLPVDNRESRRSAP